MTKTKKEYEEMTSNELQKEISELEKLREPVSVSYCLPKSEHYLETFGGCNDGDMYRNYGKPGKTKKITEKGLLYYLPEKQKKWVEERLSRLYELWRKKIKEEGDERENKLVSEYTAHIMARKKIPDGYGSEIHPLEALKFFKDMYGCASHEFRALERVIKNEEKTIKNKQKKKR